MRNNKIYPKVCPVCDKNFMANSKINTCCSRSCAMKKRFQEGTAHKVVNPNRGSAHSKSVGKRTKTGRKLKSIFEASPRTRRKIMKRLGISCTKCGWDAGVCDLHHIIPKKIGGVDEHSNIAWICPNCHRLVHEGSIDAEELVPLSDILQEDWLDSYYG